MNTVEIAGKTFSCETVIETLRCLVTPERFRKIETIASHRNKNLITVMENIYDHGNSCAVMRSAEAFGFHQFHQIVEIGKFKSAKRVSQGAEKWLVKHHWNNTESCIQRLKEQGYKIYVTHLDGGTPIDQVSFAEPVALCFGSEKLGASPILTEMADQKIFLPMYGFVQSFNISVAAALCYQFAHQKIAGAHLGSLSDDERQQLIALYLYRSSDRPDLHKLIPSMTKS